MEVTITNTTNDFKKAVVFGFNYNMPLMKNGYSDKNSFFNIKTDDGVFIEYDGNGNIEKIKELFDFLNRNAFMADTIEYTSSLDKSDIFYYYTVDANGNKYFKNIIPQIFVHSKQEKQYPILIRDEHIGIDNNSSLLFNLNPLEKITLKIIKA